MTTIESTYQREMRALDKAYQQAPTAQDRREIKAQATALTRAHISSTQVRP